MESFPAEIREIIERNEDKKRRIRAQDELDAAAAKIVGFIRENNGEFRNLLVQLLSRSVYASSRFYNGIVRTLIGESAELRAVFIDFVMNFPCAEMEQPSACVDALESYFSLLAAYVPIYSAQTEGSLTFREICEYLHERELSPLQLCLLLHYKRYIKGIDEKLCQRIEEEERKAEEIANRLRAPYFVPEVKNGDCEDPHISKFGGKCPYLPSAGPPVCREEGCGKEAELIFSIAVESLPAEIREYFPEEKRECVLVGAFCQECGKALPVTVFTKEQVEQLKYADVPEVDHPFNEPRVVTGWRRGQMTPKSIETNDGTAEGLSAPLDIYFVKSKLQKYSNPESLTYVGGYPDGEPQNTVSPAKLLLQMGESNESTNNWGGIGSAQVWMTTGEKFGEFELAISNE